MGKLKKALKWTVLGIVVIGAVFAIGLWRMLTPDIHRATPELVKSVLPPEALIAQPIDKAARQRFDQIVEILNSIHPYAVAKRLSYKSAPNVRLLSAKALRDASWLAILQADLDAGPLQHDPFVMENGAKREFSQYLASAMGQAAARASEELLDAGDSDGCLKMLTLGATLYQRLASQCTSSVEYMQLPPRIDLIEAVAYAAGNKRFPAEDCRRLLKLLPAVGVADDNLATTIRNDTLDIKVDILCDPVAWKATHPASGEPGVWMLYSRLPENLAGRFDSLETARHLAPIVKGMLANTQRPKSEYDHSPDRAVKAAQAMLPAFHFWPYPKAIDDAFKRMEVANLARQVPNMIDLWMQADYLPFIMQFDNSFRERAIQNATVVLVASRLYRADHGGSLPATSAGFLPYLSGGWPVDPMNGKPMIYNASKQVVYSVGQDLKDDGGAIANYPLWGKDFGKSLVVR